MKEQYFKFTWLRRWSLIKYFIETYKVKSLVEIGVFNADIGKRILREEKIDLDCYVMIDKSIKGICYDLKEDHPEVKILKGDSSVMVDCIEDNFADLIFVDGDHSYEGCRSDISLYTPKLKKDGWMLVHDYHRGGGGTFPGIRKAVIELWGEGNFYFIPDEAPDSARGIAFKQF